MDPKIFQWMSAEAHVAVCRPSDMLQTPEVEEPDILQKKLGKSRVAVYRPYTHCSRAQCPWNWRYCSVSRS